MRLVIPNVHASCMIGARIAPVETPLIAVNVSSGSLKESSV